ncbi:GAS2-like protein pickled eggs [Penaeus chinensis]|uniref:GAS2-like protein pickled eggs n=1 Tax=Penaeus chinensis TaxID=139456 RepID=UPI001FB6DBF7|nr:GAS2-like protein pickled eggs [Penaeus chinensis]
MTDVATLLSIYNTMSAAETRLPQAGGETRSSPHPHDASASPAAAQDAPDGDSIMLLEPRPFRPFKTSEEYLYAMREDLAEWLKNLYQLDINVDNFFEILETGEVLCRHANNVRSLAEEQRQQGLHPEGPAAGGGRRFSSKWEIPQYDVVFRTDVAPGSFFARDNVHNFIAWCRDLGIYEVLLFETDDLVMRKNEKHVILSLLEVARRGARYGMAAPLLVQMEHDIDREMEKDRLAEERRENGGLCGGEFDHENGDWHDDGGDIEDETPQMFYGPQAQIITNDLKSLDEMVRDLVERCSCPSQFPMVKVSEGKYRIGDTRVLIFVRILRNHVMVRVGGGWDTLEHYLDKHDPCRCRQGHRTALSSRVGFKTSSSGQERQLMNVTYERCDEGYVPSSPSPRRRSSASGRGIRRDSLEGRSSLRQRSQSPANRDPGAPFSRTGSGRYNPIKWSPGLRDEQTAWRDDSSEVSDEGYKSQGNTGPRPLHRNRKPTPKKSLELDPTDILERPESSMTQMSSEGSSMSTEDSVHTPPRSPTNTTTTAPHYPLTDATNTWSPPSQVKHKNSSIGTPRSKIPFIDTLKSPFVNNKKSKKAPLPEEKSPGKPAWNAGPGVRRNSLDRGERVISRSRSATSEGGLIMLGRDSPARQSFRPSARRPSGGSCGPTGKNTWNGRASRERPSLTADTYKPPTTPRTVRSASASPATTRRQVGHSAPATPLNRSPKRSAPASTLTSPTGGGPLLQQLADLEPDENTLLCIKDIYDSLKARVSESLAAEGKSLPPELSQDYTNSWVTAHVSSGSRSLDPKPSASASNGPPGSVRITPRKSGVGSRIPAPTFFLPHQTGI